MKIIILHGENTPKSYERLTTLINVAKARGWEIIHDDIGVTPSLFGTEKLIVLKDYKLITSKVLKTLNKITGTMIIYAEGNIPVTFLKTVKEAKVEKYEVPKIIWKFLDNITVKSLHEIIKTEPVEFVFAMLVWKFKKRYMARPTIELKEIINNLARIDIDAKTGKADLLLSLDLLIAKHLE